VARVVQVRPCAVTLALGLLDPSTGSGCSETTGSGAAPGEAGVQGSGPTKEGTLDVTPAMVSACAWVLGEYHDAFEGPAGPSFVKAARSMLSKGIQALEPAIQTQCIWAATKLYLGSLALGVPAVVAELHDLLTSHLSAFARSTHVDVSERAALSLHLAAFFQDDMAKLAVGKLLLEEPLLPVHPDAQKSMPAPSELGLDEPFFEPQEAPQEAFVPVKADPADPFALAATYKDDFSFLATREPPQAAAAPSGTEQGASIFYLQCREQDGEKPGDAAGASEAAAAPAADPLEQMRERLAAARAAGAGSMKYQVLREEIRAPAVASEGGTPSAQVPLAPAASSAVPLATLVLPTPPEKELAELLGRLWSVCYRDDYVGVYFCVKAKSTRKQLLRIELRCERVGSKDLGISVSDVALKFPAGVAAQEADAAGLVSLAAGELRERSSKAKANIGLAPFVAPVACSLACELSYSLGQPGGETRRTVGRAELSLPSTTFLVPHVTTEDDLAPYMQRELQQTVQVLNLSAPGRSAEALCGELPAIVGRGAGLCHFYGLQQHAGASHGKGRKFLLIAQPLAGGQSPLPGQQALPEGELVVCLCNGTAREALLELKVKVKACREDVCKAVSDQLASVFSELVEGRLRTS